MNNVTELFGAPTVYCSSKESKWVEPAREPVGSEHLLTL